MARPPGRAYESLHGSFGEKVCVFRQNLLEPQESQQLNWDVSPPELCSLSVPTLQAECDRCLCFPVPRFRCQPTDRTAGPTYCLWVASKPMLVHLFVGKARDEGTEVTRIGTRQKPKKKGFLGNKYHLYKSLWENWCFAFCLRGISVGNCRWCGFNTNINTLVAKWVGNAVTVSGVSALALMNAEWL